MLCDSHTHLGEFPPEEVPEILTRAQEADVGLIVSAGTTMETCRTSVKLAQTYPSIYAGVGLHPMNLPETIGEDTWEELRRLAEDRANVVCISETGLDFMPKIPARELQYEAFRRHIHLAVDLKLPIVFHSREAGTEVLRVLREEGAELSGGIMHYFQGDMATAHQAIELGFLISLAKPLLRLPGLQRVASELPLEHIVLETDAAPQPWKRHRRNWTEPWQVKLVAEKLAELKGIAQEEVAEVTTSNLKRLLAIN
jgi:TatD DNase family protein